MKEGMLGEDSGSDFTLLMNEVILQSGHFRETTTEYHHTRIVLNLLEKHTWQHNTRSASWVRILSSRKSEDHREKELCSHHSVLQCPMHKAAMHENTGTISQRDEPITKRLHHVALS